MASFIKWLKSYDKFGEAVGVLYKGESSYNSICGSILSLVCWLCVLGYGIRKGIEFKVGADP